MLATPDPDDEEETNWQDKEAAAEAEPAVADDWNRTWTFADDEPFDLGRSLTNDDE